MKPEAATLNNGSSMSALALANLPESAGKNIDNARRAAIITDY